jgi:PAS domain S-box-containing protein
VVSFEYDLETPIGHQYYEARMVAFREDQVLATVRNISDRRQRETALQQRQTEAEILAEVTECAVIFHRHNEVFLVNPAFTRLTGYTKEDLDGVEDLTATLFAPHCCDMIRDMIDAQSTKPYRAIMLSKEGDEFEVSIKPHYRPYNGNPEPVRIAVIVAPDIVVDEERNCD